MSFTLSHVMQGARRAPEILSSETAAYAVLSLAEQIMGAPREVTADGVLLNASGSLVVADVPHCSAQVADECLRELLSSLLERVSSATVSDALRHVVQSDAKGPVALRSELQAALVPLNRSAARRALARLYRKVAALSADSALEPVVSNPAATRRSRRRAPLEAITAPDEIPVTWETNEHGAFVPEFEASAEVPQAHWHPAQTTPWQFNEALRPRGEGTPIFGSLAVFERPALTRRDGFTQPHSMPQDLTPPHSMQHHVEPNTPVSSFHVSSFQTAEPDALKARAPLASVVENQVQEAPEVNVSLEHDTYVDHPVAVRPTSTLVRRSSRRSRVADLVQRFTTTKNEPAERAVAELYHMATASEGEFGALGTATPPPVARESLLPSTPVVKPKPRRIVLKAALTLAPMVAFWALRTPSLDVAPVPAAATTSQAECHATVRVSVPANARVFLNDQHERQEQLGPLAVFQKVPCSGQAEVTVRVPERTGSKLPDAWVRVPLPEADLVRAAVQGRALEVSPLSP